jgi:hypothetical protein
MPIYRTALTSNFTQISNDLINSSIPSTPKNILLYLLSKPVNWQPKAHDLQKQLGLTAYKVRKGLRWLCSAGYAAYIRLKSGHTIWQIFSKPNLQHPEETAVKPVFKPHVEIPERVFQPVLIKTKTEEINKPLPSAAPALESIVVVDALIYPVQLNPSQKKACKSVIKKVKQPELQQPVLFALAYAMAHQKINSIPAYLQGLVKRANDGTFEAIQADTATKQGGKPLIPIWQGFGQSVPSNPEKAKSFLQQAKSALKGASC